MIHKVLKDLFLGEGHAVDSFGPVGATDEDEGDAGVVQHAVLHTAPLVDSQAIVNIEQLLIVLQIGVSWNQVGKNHTLYQK